MLHAMGLRVSVMSPVGCGTVPVSMGSIIHMLPWHFWHHWSLETVVRIVPLRMLHHFTISLFCLALFLRFFAFFMRLSRHLSILKLLLIPLFNPL